jgi:phosphonate transport system substrate-binding protein
MDGLKFTSCQAANADPTCRAIAGYMAERLAMPVEFVDDIPWQERATLLDTGQVHVGWLCGLPYVRRVDRPAAKIDLLAAPVMVGERYQNRPVYFSDVVVHRHSPFHTFADLRGASWAYNEPGSHSGYNVTGYHLSTLGETWSYFGRVMASGAHQTSLQMILDGQIDASAIDSTVLETEVQRTPGQASRIRIIETLGPSPIPPWVVARSLPQELRQRLRRLFLQMSLDPWGQAILAAGQISKFAPVTDQDYDVIRHMARQAATVSFPDLQPPTVLPSPQKDNK